MARPRTAPGSWGKATTVGQVNRDGRWVTAPKGVSPERWRARARFRDHDGKLRDIDRFGSRKTDAERALTEALRTRETPRTGTPRAGGVLRANMSVSDAGELWLARIARPEANLSDNTRAQYRAAYRRYVASSPFASHTLRDANRPPVLRTFLEGVADAHGSGASKTARTVVSLILGAAVEDGALDLNAMRQIRTPRRSAPAVTLSSARAARLHEAGFSETQAARDTRRSFTRGERRHVVTFALTDEYAQRHDVADLIAFLAGTGVRISEALGQQWAGVDLEGGTVYVEGTKTEASRRKIPLEPGLADVLRDRQAGLMDSTPYVFASPLTGRPRDRRNTSRHLRDVLDRAGFPWATPHAFRRTVATLLDEAGQPISLAANVLGHADPSMTARVYLGRRGDTAAAANVLAL